ncbi:hypothetical protein [Microlunatus sp. GCM10028923]|uniref:hypothetical protein n=1 Tax=Microlunatus sp. GCM10028923 TaxID=3273400 RepID=UPI00361B4345
MITSLNPDQRPGMMILQRELEMAKAAVLYAESVEMLSLARQIVNDLRAPGDGPDSNVILGVLESLDDEAPRNPGSGGRNPEVHRQKLKIIRALVAGPRDSLDPEMQEQLSTFLEAIEVGRTAESEAQIRDRTDQMYTVTGAAELDLAFRTGQLRYNNRVRFDSDFETLMADYEHQVQRYLEDPQTCVLVDDPSASLVRAMIDEGDVKMPPRSVANAGEAALGTGFLSRLPTFPTAPMAQILEVKDGLAEPLGRYRRKVTDLRSHLLTGPFDQHIDAEINNVWRTEVEPAVAEIRLAIADHALGKELIRAAGADVKQFAQGSLLTGGLAILTANAFDLTAAVTASIGVGSAAAAATVNALMQRKKGGAQARANDLYYLHAVDQGLE